MKIDQSWCGQNTVGGEKNCFWYSGNSSRAIISQGFLLLRSYTSCIVAFYNLLKRVATQFGYEQCNKILMKQQGKKCKRKIQDQQTGTIASFIYT